MVYIKEHAIDLRQQVVVLMELRERLRELFQGRPITFKLVEMALRLPVTLLFPFKTIRNVEIV